MNEPDLNLLRVFDVLMEQRSVTRAAERLNLTQSAVSHSLRRLRAVLDDPLFVRADGGLRPTARAEEIAPRIRDGLGRLRGALSATGFEPAQSIRQFTIALDSYFCDLLLPRLIERLQEEAPGISLRILPMSETVDRELERGTIDFVLGGSAASARFCEEVLFEEELVWIAAAGNPVAARSFDLDQLAQLPHVTISIPRPLHMAVAEEVLIAQLFADMSIAVERGPADPLVCVYDAQTAIAIVARTGLVGMVPRRPAAAAAAAGRIVILSTADIVISLSILWHHKQQADPGLVWLRNTIRACLT